MFSKSALAKSVLAGVLISISVVASLSCEFPIVRAFIFSFGLVFILVFNLNLFTGKVGYFSSIRRDLLPLLEILLWNFIGVELYKILLYLSKPDIISVVDVVSNMKHSTGHIEMFTKAILCGVLMLLAVESYKRTNNVFLPMLCVAVFVISGYEHCIVVFFYCRYSVPTLISVLGNSIGSVLTKILIQRGDISGQKESSYNI